jgi:hypothetical protein
MLEYTWHMLFGEPPVIAPAFECDLLECTKEDRAAAEKEMKAFQAQERHEDALFLANLGNLGSVKPQDVLRNLRSIEAKDAWSWTPEERKWRRPQRIPVDLSAG